MTLLCVRSSVRMCVVAVLATTVGALALQEDNGQFQRLEGRVVDDSGQGIQGAAVKLKDLRTLLIRSYIAQENGEFHFSGLNSVTGYEVWAQVGSKRSDTHHISRFETGKVANVELKVQRE